MVAIFTGLGAGFTRSSANILGGAGQLGTSLLGRGGESVSVNAATGNLLISHQDEFLIGRGPDVGISRTYNSLEDANGSDRDNLDHWLQSTTRRVFGLTGTLNSAGSTISRLGADGSVIVFIWNAARSAYVSKDGDGAFDTLVKSGVEWIFTDGGSQQREYYQSSWSSPASEYRIRSLQDTDGNALNFSYYAASDALWKVSTQNNGTANASTLIAEQSYVEYTWSGNQLTTVTTYYTDYGSAGTEADNVNRMLTRVSYTYDADGRLSTVTTDLSPGDNSVSDNNKYVTTYTYYGNTKRIATIGQTDGSLLTITYDEADRVATLTQAVASGVTRVTTLTYGSNYTTVTGPYNEVTRLDYDASGQLTKITAPPAFAGATAQEVLFAYDAEGNVVSVTTVMPGDDLVTAYDHDANGNVTLVTDAEGNTVQRTYDSANRLITELAYGSDEAVANAAHYAQYAYDSEGHLAFSVNPAGQVTEYLYSADGELTYTREYAEHTYAVGPAAISLSAMTAWRNGLGDLSSIKLTRFIYDARGHLTDQLKFGIASSTGGSSTAEGQGRIYYTYDQSGKLLQRNADGETPETFVYDGMGRLIGSTNVHGGTTQIVFDDPNTRTAITSAGGYVTTETYDKAGALIATTGSGNYDMPSSAAYKYDNAGRLRVVTTGYYQNPDLTVSQDLRHGYMVYDHTGRKVADINEYGDIVEYRYDQAGRLVASIAYATRLGAAELNNFLAGSNFDAELPSLRPASNPSDIWSWNIYDDAGRLIQAVDNLGSTVAYTYDKSGRLVKTTAFSTKLSAGTLAGFKTNLPSTATLPATLAGDVVSRAFYNKAGQLVGSLDGEGYLSETVYDSAGRAIRTIAYATATNQADRATASFAVLRAYVAGSSTADRVAHSVYDGQGLLRYTVDALGGVTGLTYNNANKLTTTRIYANTVNISDFTYDAVKAAVATNSADRVSYVVYDDAGRAAYGIDPEGGVTAFKYDNRGNVIKTVAYDNLYVAGSLPSLTTMNSWAANSTQANDTANRVTRNYYGAGDTLRFTIDAANFVTYFNYDPGFRPVEVRRYGDPLTVSDATTVNDVGSAVFPSSNFISTFKSYDGAGRVATTTDGEGFVTRNTYNALGQLTDVTAADGTALAVTTHFTYDGASRVLTETAAYNTGDAVTVTYVYDAFGNRISVTDARGKTTTYGYDELGRAVSATNALNGVTTYEYDSFGNVVKVTDPRARSTFSYYDRLNRLVAVRDAEGYVSYTTYNRFGEVLTTARYSTAMTGTGQTGVAVFDPANMPSPPGNLYAYANQLQATADALEVQAVAAEATAVQAHAAAAAALAAAQNLPSPADVQAAYDAATQAQAAAAAAAAAAVQAAADAASAAAAVAPLQATANASAASAAPLLAAAAQAVADATEAQSDADAAQAAADAAWDYLQSLLGPSPAEIQAALDAAEALQATADALQATADTAAATAASAQAAAAAALTAYNSAAANAATKLTAYNNAVSAAAAALAAYNTASQEAADALAAKNAATTTYNNAAAAVTTAQNTVNTAASQLAANTVAQAYTNPIPPLEAYRDTWIATANGYAVAASQTSDPNAQYGYYLAYQQCMVLAGTVQDEITSIQNGNPLSSNGQSFINSHYGFTTQQITAYDTLNTNHTNALAALATAQSNKTTAQNAMNAAITLYNQKDAAKTTALNAKNAADAAVTTANAQLQSANSAAATALSAKNAADSAAATAASAATSAQAAADAAQLEADEAWDAYDLLVGGGNPEVAAAYAAAAAAQQDADALDAQADAAEAAAAAAQSAATAAAAAAAAADALVDDLEDDIANYSGGSVSFEAERTAALGNTSSWVNTRKSWVSAANSAVDVLDNGTSGFTQTVLGYHRQQYNYEYQFLNGSLSSTVRTAYINKYYDNITWRANNLGSSRSAALAGKLAWLTAREADLKNWIDGYTSVSGNSNMTSTVNQLKLLWVQVRAAKYDLANNTYSTGWPTSTSQVNNFYTSGKNNASFVPSGINNTSQQTSSYRADIVINAYFDVAAATGEPIADPAYQALLDDLADAQAAAAVAAAANTAAQAALTTANAAAATARADANAAQNDADDLLAYAQQLEASQSGNGDPQAIAAAEDAHEAAQAAADAAQLLADQAAADAAQAQAAANAAQAIANSDQAAADAAQAAANQAAAAVTVAEDFADTAQATAAAALLYAQQLEAAMGDPGVAQAALDAAAQAVADANAAQATANQLRCDADVTQADADAAYAAAQAGSGNGTLDRFVLINLSSLGASAQTQYAYDKLGRVTQKTDAGGYAETYEYTAFGQLKTFKRFNGGTSASVHADTKFEYDNRGLLTKSTDARNFYESYTYDAFGRRVNSVAKSKTGNVTAGGTTIYTYDKRGLLLTETLPISAYTGTGGTSGPIQNSYSYDALGNLTKKTEAAGLAEERVTDYVYDRLGRLTQTKGEARTYLDQNGHTAFTNNFVPIEKVYYDVNGNVTKTEDAAGNCTVFFYDALNRKTVEIDALGTYTAYEYDANGNVTRIRIFAAQLTAGQIPANGGDASAAPSTSLVGTVWRETTFTYDGLGRMLTSNVLGATTGTWNGSNWISSTDPLKTEYQYDYLGNVVKVTDPNTNVVWAYYDMLGRKTAQVDGEKYLTTWSYDFEGNVLIEKRYATQASGTITAAAPPSVAADATNDRTTEFTYDLNGNRLTEKRKSVKIHNGSGGTSAPDSTIVYAYNGLGQVISKTEAAGDVTGYAYDFGGRLLTETRQQFTDYNNQTVTPTVNYEYDGLGNLVRTIQSGQGTTLARETRYTYGAGGLLDTMTDAEGYVHQYFYDKRGLTIRDQYFRAGSAGGAGTLEAVLSKYDALGRATEKKVAAWSGSAWVAGDVSSTEYNAFGDISRAGLNGIWQQENKYDLAGRVWATNSGDGVWKYFGYDKNGNQTVAIVSAGADLTGKTFAQALGLITGADVNATYMVYNQRNLATSVVEEGREFSASAITVTTTRTYNAFGDLATETRTAGSLTTQNSFGYNTMGRMIWAESPAASITLEDGTSRWIKPRVEYYYDASGRLVAQRDANGTYAAGGTDAASAKVKDENTGNLTRLTLLAGTGYGGTQALVTAETHADGGIKQTKYDIHGDARVLIDEENRTLATNTYDKLGRLITAVRIGGLTDNYTYDILGQQVTHWNSLYGVSNKELTDYDVQGRVISSRAFGGDTTTTSYAWDATLGSGIGGWAESRTMANGRVAVEKTDIFGRLRYRDDLDNTLNSGAGHIFTYSYDSAGRLTWVQQGSATQVYQYFNTGKIKQLAMSGTSGSMPTTTYSYDNAGNVNRETVYDGSIYATTSDITANYDALGRLTSWTAASTTTTPAASSTITYDASGNIRSKTSMVYSLDASGAASTQYTVGNWFRYDSMNRVVLNNGVLDGGAIKRRPNASNSGYWYGTVFSPQSETILYNLAGQRTSSAVTQMSYDDYGVPGLAQELKEIYVYDANGRLVETQIAAGTAVAATFATQYDLPPAAPISGTRRSAYGYDAMGRQISQTDYDTNGTTSVFNSTTTYNTKGQVSNTSAYTLRNDSSTLTQNTSYTFVTSGGLYLLGAVASSSTTGTTSSTTTNSYQWWDGAVQSGSTYTQGSTNWTTTYTLNAFAQLTSAYIADGKPRTVTYKLDQIGQVIRRDESNISGQTGAPHEVWYRVGGRELGYVSNNGTTDVSMMDSISQRRAVQGSTGTFRYGQTYGTPSAEFTRGIDRINSYSQGSRAGAYTVAAGDTLQSIAQRLYGDASLWYKIGEVNGLSADSGLIEGQQLTLPGGVVRSTFNADTVKPYDPAEAIGDLSPTSPKPAKKPKCGVFGQILLAVISAVVTVVLTPILTPVGAAMAGNIVSQAVGVATGIQEKFSFKSLAMTAISAGVTQGLGDFSPFGALGAPGSLSQIGNAVVRGALGSVITQGIGVATGLQDKFSWAGVAAAGVSAGVGEWAGGGLKSIKDDGSIGNIVKHVGVGAASMIAGAATRSAISGTSFGDAIKAGIPDVIGQVAGRALGNAIGGEGEAAPHGPLAEIFGVLERVLSFPGVVGKTIGEAVVEEIQSLGSSETTVTASGGSAMATNGVLPPAIQNDPALQALVAAYKKSKFASLERKYEAQRASVDDRVRDLRDAISSGASVKEVDSARRSLVKSLDKLRIRADALSAAAATYTALEDYFAGKQIYMMMGTLDLDANGVPKFKNGVPQYLGTPTLGTYPITGRNGSFSSSENAAFDAVALVRAIGAATGKYHEATGFVVQRPDGTFGYGYNYPTSYNIPSTLGVPSYVGPSFTRGSAPGIKALEAYVDNPNNMNFGNDVVVGFWHIHPVGGVINLNSFLTFDPQQGGNNDFKAANEVYSRVKGKLGGREFRVYIGGSDGTLRSIGSSNPNVFGSVGGVTRFFEYTDAGKSAPTVLDYDASDLTHIGLPVTYSLRLRQ